MKYLYLLIDLSALAVPLLFSFHPKIKFYRSWPVLSRTIPLVAILFLIFDSLFTRLGIWNFNPRYLTGIHLYNLPVEEVLFFICIPYSCLFTFYCLNKFLNLSWNAKTETVFCIFFSYLLLTLGSIYRGKLYTSSTFVSTAIICLVLKFLFRINWFGKACTVYGVLLIPFFLVNGILTGTGLAQPVVRYNPGENLGIRLLTIPIEDFIYGFELFILNLFFYLQWSIKADSTESSK
jgi:lycopene cyclase domain-containing protein